MKLSAYAKQIGITYGTALKWFHNGILPVKAEQIKSGTIIVYPEKKANEKDK